MRRRMILVVLLMAPISMFAQGLEVLEERSLILAGRSFRGKDYGHGSRYQLIAFGD